MCATYIGQQSFTAFITVPPLSDELIVLFACFVSASIFQTRYADQSVFVLTVQARKGSSPTKEPFTPKS